MPRSVPKLDRALPFRAPTAPESAPASSKKPAESWVESGEPTRETHVSHLLAQVESQIARNEITVEIDEGDIIEAVDREVLDRETVPNPSPNPNPLPGYDDGEESRNTTALMSETTGQRLIAMIAPQIPRLLVDREAVARLPIEPREAFMLEHIDGAHTLDEVIDMSGMPDEQAREVLGQLRAMGVITLE